MEETSESDSEDILASKQKAMVVNLDSSDSDDDHPPASSHKTSHASTWTNTDLELTSEGGHESEEDDETFLGMSILSFMELG